MIFTLKTCSQKSLTCHTECCCFTAFFWQLSNSGPVMCFQSNAFISLYLAGIWNLSPSPSISGRDLELVSKSFYIWQGSGTCLQVLLYLAGIWNLSPSPSISGRDLELVSKSFYIWQDLELVSKSFYIWQDLELVSKSFYIWQGSGTCLQVLLYLAGIWNLSPSPSISSRDLELVSKSFYIWQGSGTCL